MKGFELEEDKATYKWWRSTHLINFSNEACKNIAANYLKVGNESMRVISFWKMAKGKLPHLSYIFGKPSPLGTEFKIVSCYITGTLLFVEFHIGK